MSIKVYIIHIYVLYHGIWMYSFHSLSNSEQKLNKPRKHRTPSGTSSTHHALLKEYMKEVTLSYIYHMILWDVLGIYVGSKMRVLTYLKNNKM